MKEHETNINSLQSPPLGGGKGGSFHKLSRTEKIRQIEELLDAELESNLDLFLHSDEAVQHLFAELSENYLSNFILPMGVVPNMVVNGENHFVPMVIEESSVVAAASKAAKFWAQNGGFNVKILGTEKKGQVHFKYEGDVSVIDVEGLRVKLLEGTKHLTYNMQKRKGGITKIELLDFSNKLDNYYQLDVSFETADAMGANFINSVLETMAEILKTEVEGADVIMAILSNYTPNSMVRCTVECPVERLQKLSGSYTANEFARRFKTAVDIANVDVSRAVTHNKGIFNGMDAVVLATGNDWRAFEAGGHAYAAKDGNYTSLTKAELSDDAFKYTLEVPMALGVVGGVTKVHPLAKLALRIMGNPNAEKLMMLVAAVGMANNFSAVSTLVTSGIQKGHMKMHLGNILAQLGANEIQREKATAYFADKTVSFSEVKKFMTEIMERR